MNTSSNKTIIWLCIYAIAMGFLESSVVIYLRELYYPGGFQFPLQIIPTRIARVEIWREFATIIMLVGAAYLAGKTKLQRFAYFLIAFAVWDLFYYIFLYVFIQWPQSLLTWDILFLIPFPWTGPVIAPCLVAIGMTLFGILIIKFGEKQEVKITYSQWILLLGGCLVIILSFLSDYLGMVSMQNRSASLLPNDGLFNELKTYVPVKFDWFLFLTGFLSSCLGVVLFSLQHLKSNPTLKPITNENQ
jgi:hypothetical protein